MMRRSFRSIALLALVALFTAGCVSPFSDHGQDHRDVIARQGSEAHRKWDRYFLGLDWDDPYHDWHDDSYATGPMHRP